MTPEQRAELRRLAEEAIRDHRETVPLYVTPSAVLLIDACDPDTVRGLLDALDAAEPFNAGYWREEAIAINAGRVAAMKLRGGAVNPERIAELRARHQPRQVEASLIDQDATGSVDVCEPCHSYWPCDAAELLDAYEAAREGIHDLQWARRRDPIVIRGLQSRLASALDALREHGDHKPFCFIRNPPGTAIYDSTLPCDCGFDAALASADSAVRSPVERAYSLPEEAR